MVPPQANISLSSSFSSSLLLLPLNLVNQPITGFHQDDQADWVAELGCGHGQHVRHQPPLSSRPWVLTLEGRQKFIGTVLNCKKCEKSEVNAK